MKKTKTGPTDCSNARGVDFNTEVFSAGRFLTSTTMTDVDSNSKACWWRRFSRSTHKVHKTIEDDRRHNAHFNFNTSKLYCVSMPDAIPECDRVTYTDDTYLQLTPDSLESPSFEPHVYQNYPPPDLLNATMNSELAYEVCHTQCVCRGMATPVPVYPCSTPTSDECSSETSNVEGFYGYMNKSKSISFRKASVSAKDAESNQTYCTNCVCYLDPVQLNDRRRTDANVLSHEYQNTHELILAMLSQSKYLNGDIVQQSNNLNVGSNDSRNCVSSKNKLNLKIDTTKKRNNGGGFFYDPMQDFIYNSPVIKKLRELVFTYPGSDEIKRQRLLYATIAVLIFVIIILIILNVLVPKLLLAHTLNQNVPSTPSFPQIAQNIILDKNQFSEDISQGYNDPSKLTTRRFDPNSDQSILISETKLDNQPVSEKSPIHSVPKMSTQTNSEYSLATQASGFTVEQETVSTVQLFTVTPVILYGNATETFEDNVTSSTVIESTTIVSQFATSSPKLLTSTKKPTVSTWLPTFPSNFECQKDQFRCISGVSRVPCLYKWERCDGIQDCSDGSDEILCGSDVLKCYGNFMCDDGSCVSLAKVCNGVFDCKDGSDEMKCDNFTCQSYEYRCPSGYCIPKEWTCDGEIDCPDHREEYNCSTSCPPNKFLCEEGWCIPNEWRCNGIPDCAMAEDELNCSCPADQIKCKNGGCIQPSMICDGIDHCSDGCDEHDCVRIEKSILIVRDPGRQSFLPVCSQDFKKEHANLVCKQLGFSESISTSEIDMFRGNFTEVFGVKYKTLPPIGLERTQVILKKQPLIACQSGKLIKIECQRFECGLWKQTKTHRRKRIVGGQLSAAHQWPSVGVLFHSEKKWACTASVLAPNWIITSALCIKRTDPSPFDWKLIVGSAEPTETNPDLVVRSVKKFIQHPSYKFKTLIADFDVMLVNLNEPLPLNKPMTEIGPSDPLNESAQVIDPSDHVAAICTPDAPTEPGSWCVTTGWGYTNPGGFYINKQLKQLDMGVWLKAICNGTAHYPSLITDRMMCAGNDESDWGPCFNDEGAPLMCHSARTNKWYLAGILTSQNCGSMKHPSVYADVYVLKDWINNVVGLP